VKRLSGVEGTLCWWRRAPGVGGIEDLKRVTSENLQSVERAVSAPDIYIGDICMMHIH
jgi:hypothetical protein